MSRATKILIVAAIVVSSATAAFAQGYYYHQVPAEQQHWYDRNAVGQNV
jgi:hypothetical protein